MKKAMVRVNWNKSQLKNDINPVLEKYENYLISKMQRIREFSVLQYKNAMEFRDELLKSDLKHSAINLYFAAIKQFYKMREEIVFPYLSVNNKLPYCLLQMMYLRY